MTAAAISAISLTEAPGQTVDSADQPDSLAGQASYSAAADSAAAAVAGVKVAVVDADADFGPAVDGKEAAAGRWSLACS